MRTYCKHDDGKAIESMLDRFCVQKSSSRNNNKNELDKPYKMEPVYEDLSLLHVDKSVGRRLSDLTDLKAILAIFIGEPPNSSSRPHSASIQLASQIKSQLRTNEKRLRRFSQPNKPLTLYYLFKRQNCF